MLSNQEPRTKGHSFPHLFPAEAAYHPRTRTGTARCAPTESRTEPIAKSVEHRCGVRKPCLRDTAAWLPQSRGAMLLHFAIEPVPAQRAVPQLNRVWALF
jgi:hypothetical protein